MEDLRNFHCLLKELDAYELQGQGFTENRYHNPSAAKVKSDVLSMLSDSLFEELLKQFENIQALLKCPVDGVVEPNPESQFTKDEFIVLLRRCLMMLHFLEFDTNILWEKCEVLLKILGNVCPLSLGLDSHDCSSGTTINPFSQCCSYFLGRINEESYEMLNFFSMILEGPTYRSTSVMIAANLEKAKMLYLKNKIKSGHVEENRTNASPRSEVDQPSGISSVEGTEERWAQGTQENAGHGERFTKCIPNFHKNPTEWNGLIDFIECDPEKDYLSWLSNRMKFNKWKQEKIALLKLQKRKRFGIVDDLNSRARTGAGESVKVKLQEQRSRIFGAECVKVREMHELKRQASSADPLELEYLVEPIECRSEKEKHGESEVLKEKKRKKTTFVTVKEYNLRSRLAADKSIRVKPQDQQSRISGMECVKDREVHETKGQALSADSSKLEDLVEPIEGWSENGKHGEAEILKHTNRKKKTYAIVKVYNLRARIGASKNIEIKPQEQGSKNSGVEFIKDQGAHENEGQA